MWKKWRRFCEFGTLPSPFYDVNLRQSLFSIEPKYKEWMRECCKLLQYLEARFPGRRFLLTLYSRIDSRQLSIVRPIGLVTTQLSMLMYSTLSNLDSDVLQQNRLHGWVGGRGQPYRRGASTLHWLLLALRFPDPRPMQCKSIRICLLIHLSNLCKWIHDAINSASQTFWCL